MNYKVLKQEWSTNLPRYSERQWLEIFPEAKPRVKQLVEALSRETLDSDHIFWPFVSVGTRGDLAQRSPGPRMLRVSQPASDRVLRVPHGP